MMFSIDMMSDNENIRLNITLSKYDFIRLKNWARIHGKTPTAYAGQIVGARLEANAENVKKQMEDLARLEGITLEELETRWNTDDE